MAKSKQTVTPISPGGEGSDREKTDRENVVRRSVRFFGETVHELRRVTWPTRKEVVQYTAAALITCLLMGLLVFAFDEGVAKIFALLGIGV